MATSLKFPDNPRPVYPLSEEREDNIIRSNMDAGIVVTRPRYTRMRKKFSIQWTALKREKADIIINFYDNSTKSGTLAFMWKHPITNNVYECRFSSPPTLSLTEFDMYDISVKIEEV